MKREFYAEPMMEVIDIDVNIICTSEETSTCSEPNQLTEITVP